MSEKSEDQGRSERAVTPVSESRVTAARHQLAARGVRDLALLEWRASPLPEDHKVSWYPYPCISPSGTRIATSAAVGHEEHGVAIAERSVSGWRWLVNTEPGEYVARPIDGPSEYWASSAYSLTWTSDGRYLVTASGNPECVLRLFDVSLRSYPLTLGQYWDHPCATWAPSGNFLACTNDEYGPPDLRLWKFDWTQDWQGRAVDSVHQVNEVSVVRGWEEPLNGRPKYNNLLRFGSLAISHDDARVAVYASSREWALPLLLVLRLPELQEESRLKQLRTAGSLAWSRSGEYLAVGCRASALVLDQRLRRVASLPAHNTGDSIVAWSSDDCYLALGGAGTDAPLSEEKRGRTGIRIFSWPKCRMVTEFDTGGDDVTGVEWGESVGRFVALTRNGVVLESPVLSAEARVSSEPGLR